MVVKLNFCKLDFVIGHKVFMGLRSDDFPSQSYTFNFRFLKIGLTFSDERHRARSYWNFPPPPGNALTISGITFFQLHQYIRINSSYP